MRAAAILGLGMSLDDLRPFGHPHEDFSLGVPAGPAGLAAVLVFGGDGTVHRHLPQLVRLQLPVLVVPRGSGNDFARALGLHRMRDALAAWKKFSTGANNTREVDLGVITETSAHRGYYFCCVAGAGLDGEIARRANAMPRWLRGHGGYALGVPLALARFRPPQMEITAGEARVLHHGPALLAVFANTPVYGDGMRVAPRALMNDGELDVCVVGPMNRLKLAALFPSVYLGRHLNIRGVTYSKAARVQVSTTPPLDIYADGEYVCRTPVEVGVSPRALRVIVG